MSFRIVICLISVLFGTMSIVTFRVVQYGSVPLKTYLPEGDIDLTVISVPDSRNLPLNVYHALLAEEQNGNDEYKLKDIRFIDAKVKLVKCVVNDITIDISFNQLSGLCALCFLEQMDHLIGRNHLFKRSIVLIKSWCYYESHIMGAMYGLLSTYALETLVLYIFRMYNASLASPLMVLYVFLEYYNKFNWDKFGISIDGPVNLSLLPDIVVENPTHHALFGGQFLRELINLYTVPCKIPAENRPPFMRKVVNIVDPLKTNNNLGRSVNLGNCLRIKLALRLGAGTLAEILELPMEKIQERIKNFFGNALKMNRSKFGLRPRLTFDSLLTDCFDEDDIQSDDLNANLADLLGDFNGNLRSLLSSQCTLGFPYSAGHEHHRLASLSYAINGSVMLPAPNQRIHQTGPLSRPLMGPSWRASGRGHVPRLLVHPLNWGYGPTFEVGSSLGSTSNSQDPQSSQGHGQFSAPSQVPKRERRLVFGSFAQVSMNSSLPLMDENEFPCLSG
ncbi:putative polynucleotide adenylyltransferase [Helianthus annuus]|nr:putative polynucleotide adenylyltransferase [Helianthus annuus]KAJ0722836.1 putative polynucleotide adenylyltransferase [Helianthus annuus]